MQWYNKSKEVAYDCYGQYHILCSRIALNTGIAHEDRRQYEQAYDLFKLSYEINIQVGTVCVCVCVVLKKLLPSSNKFLDLLGIV